MSILQLFCTVNDLIADKPATGVDEAYMYACIREASDYLQKEIGWFIPVTLTRKFNGRGKAMLFPGALLAITSITNDDTVLSASDYILKPDDGMWPNGPYTEILRPDTSGAVWVCKDNGVEIVGPWGLYMRSGSTGATVQDAPQSSSQGTLKVSNGSKVSPGMTLLIESEQQVVTGWDDPTPNITTINMAAGVTVSDETITVADGSLLNVGEVIRADFEQMKLNDRRGHQFSVSRGWNGTSRVSHANNTQIDVYRTVTVERGVNGTAADEHAQNTAVSRYFPPDDVKFLCKEIATLMANKAAGGYQGREGNSEMGTVFYRDAFPHYDIEQVKKNYSIPRA